MIVPDLKRFTESNRAAWNEVMPLHQRASSHALDQLFSQPAYVQQDKTEIDLLQKVGLKGRNVAHLCCNNGSELLSLKNLGAAECVGFDISDQAILEARQRCLGRALVLESFKRMQVSRIRYAYIASEAKYPLVSHLYSSLHPVETYQGYHWVKKIS